VSPWIPNTVIAQQGALESGGSFPLSPSENDLFYRTDRDLIYFYDGTRWLTVSEYTLPLTTRTALGSGIAATSTLANMPSGSTLGNIFVKDLSVTTFVLTTNNGTNFWTVTLEKITPGNTPSTIGSVDTSADAADTWVNHVDAINEVVVGADHPVFRLQATKTSAAGNFVCGGTVTYRLVG